MPPPLLLLLLLLPAPALPCSPTWPVASDFTCINAAPRVCATGSPRACSAISGYRPCGSGGDCCPAAFNCSLTDAGLPQCSGGCPSAGALVTALGSNSTLIAGVALGCMAMAAALAYFAARHCDQVGKLVVDPNQALVRLPFTGGEPWHSPPLACGAPPGGRGLFAYSFCCTCFAAAEVAAAAGENYWRSWVAALLPCCGGACLLAQDRTMLSMRINVVDGRSAAATVCCMLWCQPCHLAQMLNHLAHMRDMEVEGPERRELPLPVGGVAVTAVLDGRLGPAVQLAAAAAAAAKEARRAAAAAEAAGAAKAAAATALLRAMAARKGQYFDPAMAVKNAYRPPPPLRERVLPALGLVLQPWYYGRGAVVRGFVSVGREPGELQAGGQVPRGAILLRVNGLELARHRFEDIVEALETPLRPLTLCFFKPPPRPAGAGGSLAAAVWADDVDPEQGQLFSCERNGSNWFCDFLWRLMWPLVWLYNFLYNIVWLLLQSLVAGLVAYAVFINPALLIGLVWPLIKHLCFLCWGRRAGAAVAPVGAESAAGAEAAHSGAPKGGALLNV